MLAQSHIPRSSKSTCTIFTVLNEVQVSILQKEASLDRSSLSFDSWDEGRETDVCIIFGREIPSCPAQYLVIQVR
jgi:hypothetical protein